MTPEEARQNAFQMEVLRQWGDYVVDYLGNEITKRGLIDTQSLRNSLRFEVIDGQSPTLRLYFSDHGRFLDIRGYKYMVNKAKIATTGGKPKTLRRRSTKWYSTPLWGRLNDLIDRLTNEYGQWVADNMIEEFGGNTVTVNM